jgi:uncharacterized protein
MNSTKLPNFTYHPNPVETGSIKESDTICQVCEQQRGMIYTGPVYSEEVLNEAVCPWCIADGKAHEKFGAEFVNAAGVGGYRDWEQVPDAIIEGVAYRTPGFSGWQQERWFTHCGDAAEFLGCAGKKELQAFGADAICAIQRESGLEGADWSTYYGALDKNIGPTAYIFRCRHCSTVGGYSDYT